MSRCFHPHNKTKNESYQRSVAEILCISSLIDDVPKFENIIGEMEIKHIDQTPSLPKREVQTWLPFKTFILKNQNRLPLRHTK